MAKAAQPRSLEQLQLELKASLDQTGALEAVQLASRGGDIRALCRCTDENRWLTILYEYFRRDAEIGGLDVFIGQKYMMLNNNLTAAWVVILTSEVLGTDLYKFRELLQESILFVDSRVKTRSSTPPGVPRDGEPKEYVVPLPTSVGFGKKMQSRVRSLTTAE